MTGYLKDDLTVALDDVDRTAGRIITIYRDVGALARDPATAQRLQQRADRLTAGLERFNSARRAHHQTPEVEEPERAHLQALWLALKSALSEEPGDAALEASLQELHGHLAETVARVRALGPGADIEAALQELLG